MTPRAWLAFCVCALFTGLLSGWALRATSTGDRYLNSLAEQHEAAAAYHNAKLDQLISENERIYRNVKHK